MPSASTARRRSGGSRSVVLSIVIPDGATAPIRNPDTPASVSGFRARAVARPGMTSRKLRAAAIVPAPALFSARPGHSSITALAFKKRGDRSAARRIGLPFCFPCGKRASQRSSSAIFRFGAALFARTCNAHGLSVSELLAPARSNRRRDPVPSRCHACEARQRAPVPIPFQDASRNAPRGSRRAYRKTAGTAGDKISKKIFSR